MDVTVYILTLAGLLVVVSLVQPLAVRLKLPHSVLLAGIGVAIGLGSSLLMGQGPEVQHLASPLANLPIRSATFINVFLPVLLFHAALTIDVRRMAEDAAPILLLAVVAVFVATAFIGFGLWAVAAQSLTVCLLVGAIVATTDPAAVIAVFRDLGAPARLTRLVEGESLLNDAAAIAIFTFLLGMLVSKQEPEPLEAALTFGVGFLGGLVLGIALGRIVVAALPLVSEMAAAEVTLSLALPYIAFVLGEMLHVSGVVAVVAAGLVLAAAGRSRLSPASWAHLRGVWEQIAYWAGSLLFILASILVPKMLTKATAYDLVLVLAVVAAALAARALVLFAMLPALSALGLAQTVDHRYKLVITWGGLRGAVTLALALAVTESRALDPRTKTFVAVLATGFVLYTLLVQGTTLRMLIRRLGLDRLPPLHQVLRRQVLALSLAEVRDAVRTTGAGYGAQPETVEAVAGAYDARSAQAGGEAIESALTDKERLATGLVALADRERELVLVHHGHGTATLRIVEKLLRHAAQIADAARAGGRTGYNRAARRMLDYGAPFRIAYLLQRWTGLEAPLARQLGDRFELLMVRKAVLDELLSFNSRRMPPLLGPRIAEILAEILAGRHAATVTALEALRLQYPDYAEAMERRFLRRFALRQELTHYRTLHAEGLIGEELYDHLRREVRAAEKAAAARPRLDLRLSTRGMIDKCDLFAGCDQAQCRRLARLLKPRFAVPGETILRRGDKARSIYFISSGAVEVIFPRERIRLGRGEFFGEIAVLEGGPRVADVVALGYSRLLVLDHKDLRRFLDQYPALKDRLESTAHARSLAGAGVAEIDAASTGAS